MKIALLLSAAAIISSCTFSDSPKYDSTKKEAEPPVQHTGNAAVLDDSLNNAPQHEANLNQADSNGLPEGSLSGKGTTKTDIAKHGIGNSTPGFKTTTIDTVKKK